MICTKYGCDYQLDLDGQVTCTECGAMDDDMLPRRTYNLETQPLPVDTVNTSRIDTCWTCGDSAIEERERIALAVQKRHDDGSDFNKQWTNHHGLDRCDCDELVEFIRGLDKTFWDGMNRSLEQGYIAIEKELTPLSKSQVRRITKVKSDELRKKGEV